MHFRNYQLHFNFITAYIMKKSNPADFLSAG